MQNAAASVPSQDTQVGPLSLLITFGGYVSFAYVLGYIYKWAYLDVFGATALIAEVPVVEALFGTVVTITPVGAYVVAALLENKISPQPRTMILTIAGATALAGAVIAMDMLVGKRLLENARFILYLVTASGSLLAGAACAELAVSAWKQRAPFILPFSGFLVYSFALSPFLFGMSEGFGRAAWAETELPKVIVRGKSDVVYLLFTTDERVYGVTPAPSLSPGKIVPIPWDSVESITGVREVRRRRGTG